MQSLEANLSSEEVIVSNCRRSSRAIVILIEVMISPVPSSNVVKGPRPHQ
jgi:hypothetical protein